MPCITRDGDPHRAIRGTQQDTDTTRMPSTDHPSRAITTLLTLRDADCDRNPVLSAPFYIFQKYTHCVICRYGNRPFAVSVSQRDIHHTNTRCVRTSTVPTRGFIHSAVSLPYDRSTASAQASSPHSAI